MSKTPDTAYPVTLNGCVKDESGQPLTCYACAHSASNWDNNHPFPGRPSGERPCGFCVRNLDRERWNKDHLAECTRKPVPPEISKLPQQAREAALRLAGEQYCFHPAHGLWYDGSHALKNPSDNYHTMDYMDQMSQARKDAESRVRMELGAEQTA